MKLGFIGIGVMGEAMVKNLINAGNSLHVYNRTKSKTDGVVAAGALYHPTPMEVMDNSEIIFTMVGFPKDVEEVYFGDKGIFQSEKIKGKILVDMTTTKPVLALKIFEEATRLGATSLDAPVSGGDLGAKNGTLTIMVGGSDAAYQQVHPYFEIMGTTINLMGGPSMGSHTKMANQIGIAGTMTAMTETLVYAKAAGLDLQQVIDTLSGGGASTWSLTNYSPRILKEDFTPGFFVKHFIKDLGIALEEAEKMEIQLPSTELAKSLYEKLAKKGYNDEGTQSLIKLWWD
ncbi:MAG: NAD(P)-dependent oxidoreductase [Streptococcaceae bacterium]|jgi:3-hydroxyisobutyrate dehydrogenase|nr:NAD(P)-dependent oxidoreductase [Streptococcaceae bacterium]